MNIHVQYFAILREQRGLSSETIDSAVRTPRELYEMLRTRHRFTLGGDRIRVAVNDEFAAPDAALQDGDLVVFLPPVAGG